MWETWNRSGSSSRNSTRCGFPIDSAVARTTTPPPRSSDSSRNVSHAGPRIGMAAFVKFGSPMSTVTRSSDRNVTRRVPARVPTSNDGRVSSPRSRRNTATQRMPLPHISAMLPSAFR